MVHGTLVLGGTVNDLSKLKDLPFSVSQPLCHIKYLHSSSGLAKVIMESRVQEQGFSAQLSDNPSMETNKKVILIESQAIPTNTDFALKEQMQTNKPTCALDWALVGS